MPSNLPFREAPPPTRPDPPRELTIELPGAAHRLSAMRLYFGLACGLMAAAFMAEESPEAAVVTGAFVVASCALHYRRTRAPPTVRLRVEGDELRVEGARAAPLRVPLDALREVEMEGKDIRRRSEREGAGPTIPTTVSEYGDVTRVVFVSDGARVRLTESYATYSECTEQFRKVRVFLRAHGWLPASERADGPEGDRARA